MTTPRADLASTSADLVARLRRAMRRAARAAQPSLDLSVAQLELLSIIEEHTASRPGELAQILRLAPNSVSTLANSLAAGGMLERTSGSTDKRAVRYSLTPLGASRVTAWRQTNTTSLARAIDALTTEEQTALAAAMPVLNRLVVLLDVQTDRIHDDEEPRVQPIV